MKVQVIGCNHHTTDIEFRERLAFQPNQVTDALDQFQKTHPDTEAVLLDQQTQSSAKRGSGRSEIED